MCGRCRHVFNAFESLQRKEDEVVVASLAGARVAGASVAGAGVGEASAAQAADELQVEFVSEPEFAPETSAAATAFDAETPLPPVFRANEPEVPAELASVIDTLGSVHATDADHTDTPAPPPFSEAPLPVELRIEPALDIKKIAALPTESPLIFTDVPKATGSPLMPRYAQELKRPSRWWTPLSVVMALVLLTLVAYQFRSGIVQTYPQFRPAFATACGVIGCKVFWGRDAGAIHVAGTELVETPGKPGNMIASATLANRSTERQDLPSVELRLTSNTNQVLISRILEPADYLGRAMTADDSIAANADLAINLNIEIPPTTAASGYEFLPFYR